MIDAGSETSSTEKGYVFVARQVQAVDRYGLCREQVDEAIL